MQGIVIHGKMLPKIWSNLNKVSSSNFAKCIKSQRLRFAYLNNFFNLFICLSILLGVPGSVHPFVIPLALIPALVSQNITNESLLVCVMSEIYAFWITLRPLGSMRQREDELKTHYVSSTSQRQSKANIPTKRVFPSIINNKFVVKNCTSSTDARPGRRVESVEEWHETNRHSLR